MAGATTNHNPMLTASEWPFGLATVGAGFAPYGISLAGFPGDPGKVGLIGSYYLDIGGELFELHSISPLSHNASTGCLFRRSGVGIFSFPLSSQSSFPHPTWARTTAKGIRNSQSFRKETTHIINNILLIPRDTKRSAGNTLNPNRLTRKLIAILRAI